MTFWIVAAAVVAVLGALAWWTSGRSKRTAFDPHSSLLGSDAYRRSVENQTRFDPGGPFSQ
ncbi:hypothetical protein G5V58_10940 [Nocardioides anomalus]|uniref:Uncharacterized protein n=1 Tax=Nocardioides anomalus TaxID=2712223 RepID=A0A6G6WD82_9ACTN|nr:hypothetical protein [Nocardioides anomalus]QIG43202.1 hypothetical protein G5V58_10940 [Nocardioides anomalus]